MSIARDKGLLTGARWVIQAAFEGNWPYRVEGAPERTPNIHAFAGLFPEHKIKLRHEVTVDDPFPTSDWLCDRRDELIKSVWGTSLEELLAKHYGIRNKDRDTGLICQEALREAHENNHYGRHTNNLAQMLEYGKHSSRWESIARAVGAPPTRENGCDYPSVDDPRRVMRRGVDRLITLFLTYAALGDIERATRFKGCVELLATHIPMCFAPNGDVYLLKL